MHCLISSFNPPNFVNHFIPSLRKTWTDHSSRRPSHSVADGWFERKQVVIMCGQRLMAQISSPTGIGGSVVECSPATRATRVRFPADATYLLELHQQIFSPCLTRNARAPTDKQHFILVGLVQLPETNTSRRPGINKLLCTILSFSRQILPYYVINNSPSTYISLLSLSIAPYIKPHFNQPPLVES